MTFDTDTLVITPAPSTGSHPSANNASSSQPSVGSDPQTRVALAMLDACQDGLLMVGTSGQLLHTNTAADRLLGESMRAYVGRSILAWIHDRGWTHVTEITGLTPPLLRDLLSRAVCDQGQSSRRVFEQQTGDSPRIVEERGTPVQASDGSALGWMLTWRDITEERQQARAREEVSHMMIHDLRSPLTAIIGSLTMLHDLMIEEAVDIAPYDGVLRIAHNSSAGMLNLIESLLDIARIDQDGMALSRTTQALPPVIDDACTSILSLAYRAHIQMAIEVPEDLPPVSIDADKIRRVLVNLLDNGLRHTPVDGLVTVRASASPGSSEIVVCVADTGPGVPVAQRERIFDKFVQLQSRAAGGGKGFGLGLTFCKLAVETHGGRIWIDEAPGGGAAFCFSLPAVTEP
ncbi:sensor histidine kinase [Aggregatilinea lenta]|uniref:sensor histidine kinase n=1 Tax=Aggregatilinea lenta TaxID=913108 RepID=UPI0013C2C5C0|nr:PAS domain-containing sensor histidine kinase [Aggregatilinea lenta]